MVNCRQTKYRRAISGVVAAVAAMAVTVGPAAWAGTVGAAQTAAPLRLTALAWSAAKVNATSGTARAKLTWRVTDAAPGARNVAGKLVLGVPGKSGKFASLVFTVSFALHGGRGVNGSGTAQNSRYRYTFHVPQFAQVSPAKWQVIRFTAHDDLRDSLTLPAAQLSGFHASLVATELVDRSAPSYGDLALVPNNAGVSTPYVYVTGHHGGSASYTFSAYDSPAGLYRASMRLAGPHGRTISVRIPVNRALGQAQCGFMPNNDPTNMQCGIRVTFPARTPLGRWVVSALTLTDAAGNTATFRRLNAVPVTVTSNQVVRASSFSADPNPVDNWSAQQSYTIQFSMKVSGERRGVRRIYLDTFTPNGATCTQTQTKPVVTGDTFTVPIQVNWMMEVCQVTGIAVVDGMGDVSLYGPDYGAPDPHFMIRQVPNASAPRAASASISPASVSSSQTGFLQLTMTINLTPGYAPVDGISVTVYDPQGNAISGIIGGAFDDQGVVTEYVTINGTLQPGTYPIAFSINNAAQMSTAYGPGANPVPGGPLTLTVTAG